jgi:hypothetical protein
VNTRSIYSPKRTFLVDSAHLQPVCGPAGSTQDALPDNPRLNGWAIGSDCYKPLCEKISETTVTDRIACKQPQVADIHLTFVINADPRTIVKLVDRSSHVRCRNGEGLSSWVDVGLAGCHQTW